LAARSAAAVLLAFLALLAGPVPAAAAEPQLIGTFRDWNAFLLEEPGGRVCWIASRPKKDEGNYRTRGDIFALVTHRPYENSRDVVSFVAGYAHQDKSEVIVRIGQRRFTLFTEGDTSWTRDEKADRDLVAAIRSGSGMVVEGISSRGTRTRDTYSLAGSGAALDAIAAACPAAGS
jgi:hypothetical protein